MVMYLCQSTRFDFFIRNFIICIIFQVSFLHFYVNKSSEDMKLENHEGEKGEEKHDFDFIFAAVSTKESTETYLNILF